MIWSMLPIGKILAGVTIAAVIGSGILYVKNLQSTVDVLKDNNLKLTQAIDTQQILVDQQSNDIKKVTVAFTEQIKINEMLQNDLESLKTIFNKINAAGKQRDIGELAIAKPILIQKIINNGTKDVFECLEQITGKDFENIGADCGSISD